MPDPPFMRLTIDGRPPIDGRGTLDVGYKPDPFDLSDPEDRERFPAYARVQCQIEGSGSITVLRHVGVRADPMGRPWTAEEVVARNREYRGLTVQPGPPVKPETCGAVEGHPNEDCMVTGRVLVTQAERFEERVLVGRVTLIGWLILERISFDLVAAEEMVVEQVVVSPEESEE